jgi:hypothetical protein
MNSNGTGTGDFTAVLRVTGLYLKQKYSACILSLKCSVCAFLFQMQPLFDQHGVLMVSTFKPAQRKEIVSRPPEKTLSTATAEAGKDGEACVKQKEQKTHPGLGWTRYHMQDDTGWEMKIKNLT